MSSIRPDQKTILSNVSSKPLTLTNLKELTSDGSTAPSIYLRRKLHLQTNNTDQKITDVATSTIAEPSSTSSSPIFSDMSDMDDCSLSISTASNSLPVSYISSPPEEDHKTNSAFSKVVTKSHSIYFSQKKDQDKNNI